MNYLRFVLLLLAGFLMLPEQVQAQFSAEDSTRFIQLLQQSNFMQRSGRKDDAAAAPTYEALAILRAKQGPPQLFFSAYVGLGDFYMQRNQVDSATIYYTENLKLAENQLGINTQYYSLALSGMGGLNYAKGNYAAAAKQFHASLKPLKAGSPQAAFTSMRIHWQLGSVYSEWGKLDSSLWAFDQVQRIAKQSKFQDPSYKPTIYSTVAKIHMMKGDINRADQLIDSAMIHIPAAWGNNNPIRGSCLSLKADLLMLKQEYRGALEKYQEATAITRALARSEDDIGIAFAMAKEANAYVSVNNVDQALKNYLRAISILKEKTPEDEVNLARLYHSIAVAFDRLLDFERSLYYNQKALEIYERRNMMRDADANAIYLNIGACYQGLKQLDKAIEYLQIGVGKSKVAQGEHHHRLINLYTRLGGVYEEQNQLDSAALYYDKAIGVVGYHHGKEHFLISELLAIKGIVVAQQGNYQAAADILDQSRRNYLATKENATDAIAPFTLISLNYQLAQAYFKLGQANSSIPNFALASTLFEELSQRMTEARQRFTGQQAKEMLNYGLPIIYDWAIQTELVLGEAKGNPKHDQQAFAYAENAKAILLLESLQEAKAKQIIGVPDSTIRQEQEIQERINGAERQAFLLAQAGEENTDSAMLVVQDQLYNLRNDYEALKKKIEKDNPSFYQLKYQLAGIRLEEVKQQVLSAEQTLLEYFVGDSSLFVFLVQKDYHEIVEVKRDFPLEEWVEDLVQSLTSYYRLPIEKRTDQIYKESLQSYIQLAQQLYQKLIDPIEDRLTTSELIIVPDGTLNYLPFGALLAGKPGRANQFATYPFLENRLTISYCYSSTLLREMKQKKHRKAATGSIIAFAPFSEAGRTRRDTIFEVAIEQLPSGQDTLIATDRIRSGELVALPSSGVEAQKVSEIWSGRCLLGSEASEAEFKSVAENYRIIHLSTHGVIDTSSDYSFLAFAQDADQTENEYLYIRELYNLLLNADMVVLSACKTALGRLQSGEGVISLARGFAFAGAKSIVTTLWVANDEATKDLMIDFHQELKQQKSKDRALKAAKAKLQKDNTFAHPFFWASFIAVGDMSPLQ